MGVGKILENANNAVYDNGVNETPIKDESNYKGNTTMVKLDMLMKKMTYMFRKIVLKMSEKEDISNLKGSVPDILKKILFKLEMEEYKEYISSEQKMMKKIKMIKYLYKKVMGDNYAVDTTMMDQWSKFMDAMREKFSSGNNDKELAKMIEYLWDMTFDKAEEMTLQNLPDDSNYDGPGNGTIMDSDQMDKKNMTMKKLEKLMSKLSDMFEKMLKKMSGKEDISSVKGTIPEFLDKVLLSIEMEEDKETMSDSKKMMKKMKIIKSLFKSVMDDNYKKDEILMSQWNTFVNEILKRLESGKLEKESIKAFEYLWKMSMDKNEAMLWGNKEDFFTGNMTQDISKEQMKNNTMVKVSMLLEKMTGMFKKMVMKMFGKEDIAK